MEYYPVDPNDHNGDEPPDFGQEDQYFEFGDHFDSVELEVDGLLITPANSIIDVYTGHSYDHVTVAVDEGDPIGRIVPQGLLRTMALIGWRVRDNGPASEEIKLWYEYQVTKYLDQEIAEFQQQNPA